MIRLKKSSLTAGAIGGFAVKWFILIFFLVFTLAPLLWLFIASFKTNLELTTNPFGLPKDWQFGNYAAAFRVANLGLLFVNSIIVAAGSTAFALLVASLAAFALSREKFRLAKYILVVIAAGVLVPRIGLLSPYFRLITSLGLYDTRFVLILTYAAVNLPIQTFLLNGYMSSIPYELEEAAVIDGCSIVQRYSKIILPLSKTGLVTGGTFVFLFGWNEFIYALLFTSRQQVRTIQFGIRFFVHQFFTDYTSMFAAIILTIIPTIAVYILFHEQIIKGLTSGAVKG